MSTYSNYLNTHDRQGTLVRPYSTPIKPNTQPHSTRQLSTAWGLCCESVLFIEQMVQETTSTTAEVVSDCDLQVWLWALRIIAGLSGVAWL